MGGAAVGKIIAIHGSDHGMSEIKMLHSFSDVTRLVRVECYGSALAHRTETAVTCADVAAQHEGRCSVGPALKDVGALRFLADRVQLQPLNQFQKMIVVGWIADTNPQPFRLGLTGFWVQDCKFA
jgi:hypothetical protein